jgi:pyruvate dehydrogenase E2 component (dihydrolipoyllysine-residue acetyltransferase)
MPIPLHTPRVNNNDDFVRLTQLFVSPGSFVRQGDPVADVETDKATFTVEAERDGYVLGFNSQPGESIAVGSVLAWIGATADEAMPSDDGNGAPLPGTNESTAGTLTLKAALLLAQYGLKARDVPASGERLSASDVERYVASHGGPQAHHRPVSGTQCDSIPPAVAEPGKQVPLTPHGRGMLRTVAWHKSEAVPAYLEMSYDPASWAEYAAAFQQRHGLLLNPLLALLARRLVGAALDQPAVNATVVGEQGHLYDHVNLGFTVQSGDDLMVVVVREAENLDELAFAQRLGELQRSAMRNTLRPEETSGATIGFSSMARWSVSRHVPVLLPQTALMIAHTAPAGESARLGATYDHRVLNGGEVVRALQALARPSANGVACGAPYPHERYPQNDSR